MFATLVGTNTEERRHSFLFDRLVAIANDCGFISPQVIVHTLQHPIDRYKPSSIWSYEQKAPLNGDALFCLVVIAPDTPGCSPINPFSTPASAPLFAVNVLKSYYIVWREEPRREFVDCKDSASIETTFKSFLDAVSRK